MSSGDFYIELMKLGPDFNAVEIASGQMSYAKFLVDIGCSEERGNKMQAVSYVLTDKGRELYNLLDN